MNIRPDDPRLTAYHLGELPSDEVQAVERAAATDPAVRLALRQIGGLTGFLEDALGPAGRVALRPPQREAIRRAGREADAAGKVVELRSARRSRTSWLTGLGAAAAVVFAAVLVSRFGDPSDGDGVGDVRSVALLPQPGPESVAAVTGTAAGGDSRGSEPPTGVPGGAAERASMLRHLQEGPLPEAGELPATADQTSFTRSPRLRLPVVVGTASGTWVRRWINEKNELPPARAVRVEEMVNAVSLPTPLALASGANLGLHRVDWGGSRWVGVQLTAGDEDLSDLVVISQGTTAARRVVGSFGHRDDAALPTTLRAGSSTLVLLEFEGEGSDAGELWMRWAGGSATTNLDGGPGIVSTDTPAIRHVVATAIFGRWLRGEAELDRLRAAIAVAGEGEVDPLHLEDQRLMRRAIDLAGDTK